MNGIKSELFISFDPYGNVIRVTSTEEEIKARFVSLPNFFTGSKTKTDSGSFETRSSWEGNEYFFAHTVTTGDGAPSESCERGDACTQTRTTYDLGFGVSLTTEDVVNQTITKKEYDELGRLRRIYLPSTDPNDTDGLEDTPSMEITNIQVTTLPNYVRAVAKVDDQKTLISREYADAFGRSLGKVSGVGSEFILSGYSRVNSLGEVQVSYRPFSRNTEDFPPSPLPNQGCAVNPSNGAYCSEFTYKQGRIQKITLPGGATTETYKGEDYLISTDENGIQTYKQSNAFGEVERIETDFKNQGSETHTITTNEYDGLGNLKKTIAPRGLTTTYFYDGQSRLRGVRAPEGNQTTKNGYKAFYDYDDQGRLTHVWNGKNVTHTQYDALNRPTIIRASSDGGESWTIKSENVYDEVFQSYGQGKVTTVKTFGENAIEKSFAYDAKGRVETETRDYSQILASLGTIQLNYFYDHSGKLLHFTDPRGNLVEFSYDAFGRLKAKNDNPSQGEEALRYDGNSIVDNVIYDQASRIKEVHYGHGLQEVYEFTPRGRTKEIGRSAPLGNSSYTYYPDGSLRKALESDGASVRFGYDHLQRLTSAQGTSPRSFNISYDYDSSGNMLKTSGTEDPTQSVFAIPNRVYDQDSNCWVGNEGETCQTSENPKYDEHGNITFYSYTLGGEKKERRIAYDMGRVSTIDGPNGRIKIFYDANGSKLVRELPGGKKEVYIPTPAGLTTFNEETSEWKTHLSALGRQIAIIDHQKKIHYSHSDRLASVSAVTTLKNSQIVIEKQTHYLPFGEELKDLSDASTIEKFGYTSQEREKITELYDYGARYYDPILRRFFTADSVLGSPTEPQTLNRFAYGANNPLKFFDPTGHSYEDPEEEKEETTQDNQAINPQQEGTTWFQQFLDAAKSHLNDVKTAQITIFNEGLFMSKSRGTRIQGGFYGGWLKTPAGTGILGTLNYATNQLVAVLAPIHALTESIKEFLIRDGATEEHAEAIVGMATVFGIAGLMKLSFAARIASAPRATFLSQKEMTSFINTYLSRTEVVTGGEEVALLARFLQTAPRPGAYFPKEVFSLSPSRGWNYGGWITDDVLLRVSQQTGHYVQVSSYARDYALMSISLVPRAVVALPQVRNPYTIYVGVFPGKFR